MDLRVIAGFEHIGSGVIDGVGEVFFEHGVGVAFEGGVGEEVKFGRVGDEVFLLEEDVG